MGPDWELIAERGHLFPGSAEIFTKRIYRNKETGETIALVYDKDGNELKQEDLARAE